MLSAARPNLGSLKNWFQRRVKLEFFADLFVLQVQDEKLEVAFQELQKIEVQQGLVYDDFVLHCANRTIRIQGLAHKQSNPLIEQIVAQLQNWLLQQFLAAEFDAPAFAEQLSKLLASPEYLSQSFIKQQLASWHAVGNLLAHPYFNFALLPDALQTSLKTLEALREPHSQLLQQRNETFIADEIALCKQWLANLESYPLTDEQLRAVVTDEDRNLLIASAGSGKSSTLVAKVVYLLKKGLAQPAEIALLAYNEEASLSIRQRLNRVLGEPLAAQISISTFHALGLDIIYRQQGFKPQVIDLAQGGSRALIEFFARELQSLTREDTAFQKAWFEYLALYKLPRPPLFSIKTQHQYYDYLLQIGAKYHKTSKGKRRPVFTTLNGLQVTSLEALMIANWLVLHGVQFQYLKPVDLGEGKQGSAADFYYPEINLYHDHFAINSEGKRPLFLEGYDDYLAQKQSLAKAYDFAHLVTTSADFENGSIFTALEQTLVEHGLEITPIPLQKQFEWIQFTPQDDLRIFCSFLQHFKANGANLVALQDKIQRLQEQSHRQEAELIDLDILRTQAFLGIFSQLYLRYQAHLNQQNAIDFNDQIIQACHYLEDRRYQHPFRYLLVDEFQDISQDRKRLLQSLLQQNPQCKILAVGDDWQSIYRFSGADIDIMTHFERHFGTTATNYLTQTFRCYQGIADVASRFVQSNPEQLQKTVRAHDDIQAEQIIIEAYGSKTEHDQKLMSILDKLNRLAQKRQMVLQVYLLARYHRLKPENFEQLQMRFTGLALSFKSIHASKGLEADYVLLLNMESGTYGFPSTLSDDPLLHLVIPQFEHFEHAEERRLLYVALTRAKRGVFILSNSVDTSVFVSELMAMQGVKSSQSLQKLDICPKCEQGKMQERYGQYGIFWGCSLFPACDHTEKCFCPECGVGTLVARESERGRFYGCSTYPECDYIHSRENQTKPLVYTAVKSVKQSKRRTGFAKRKPFRKE